MAQKAPHSGSSRHGSPCPRRDRPEMRGKALRPRTAISWPLAMGGVMGDSASQHRAEQLQKGALDDGQAEA